MEDAALVGVALAPEAIIGMKRDAAASQRHSGKVGRVAAGFAQFKGNRGAGGRNGGLKG